MIIYPLLGIIWVMLYQLFEIMICLIILTILKLIKVINFPRKTLDAISRLFFMRIIVFSITCLILIIFYTLLNGSLNEYLIKFQNNFRNFQIIVGSILAVSPFGITWYLIRKDIQNSRSPFFKDIIPLTHAIILGVFSALSGYVMSSV